MINSLSITRCRFRDHLGYFSLRSSRGRIVDLKNHVIGVRKTR